MAVIEHEAEIEASQEAVFGLVSRVEEFALYSDAIETIEHLGGGRYLWRIRVAGLPQSFEVESSGFSDVLSCRRPRGLASAPGTRGYI